MSAMTERRKPGPPPYPPGEKMQNRVLRLRPNTIDALEALAKARGTTLTALVREAVDALLEREGTG